MAKKLDLDTVLLLGALAGGAYLLYRLGIDESEPDSTFPNTVTPIPAQTTGS